MNNQTLAVAQLSQRLQRLIDETGRLMDESGNPELRINMGKELLSAEDRKELTIALVGQYSSGKSTIVSALTGNKDIKIDANVSTDVVSEYEWHGIKLLDTPGILAGKCEQHDDRTKEALKNSDLIIYVITSQLFDDVIFNNFIDLAYNQLLKDKMLIVVNKMSMEASDDFGQLVNSYMTSLSHIFEERGYKFDFPVAFIDAADYIEGVADGDDDFIEMSRFGTFINQLDAFAEEKGLIKKQFDTPIRILQSHLGNLAIAQIDEHMVSLMNQYASRINKFMRDTKREIRAQLATYESECISEIWNVANRIGEEDEQTFRHSLGDMNNRVQIKADETLKILEDSITTTYTELQTEMGEFANNDSLNLYLQDIETKLSSPTISIEEKINLEKQRKYLDNFKAAGSWLGRKTPGVNYLFGGVSQASGSPMRNAVYNVGKYFGHKFKPWEATRIACNVGKFAKFGIPAFTTVFDIWMQVREEKKQEERRQQIKAARQQFVSDAKKEIRNIRLKMEQYLIECSITPCTAKLQDINENKILLAGDMARNEKLIAAVKSLNAEYVDFIEIVDGSEIHHKAN